LAIQTILAPNVNCLLLALSILDKYLSLHQPAIPGKVTAVGFLPEFQSKKRGNMRPRGFLLSLHLFLAFAVLPSIVTLPKAQAQTYSVIHNFTGGADGGSPLNGLFLNSKGVMYGTASAGGTYGSGVVFQVAPKGSEKVLYTFTGGSDGGSPQSFLIEDKAGNLYGTTNAGGASGSGTVFKISGTKETVLYSFGAQSNDGSVPDAGLAMDASGNLYGTTTEGGLYNGGTVFKLVPAESGSWTENILYNFGNGTDGATPVAGVTLDASGNLYGTTSAGGAYGYGRVFELSVANSWGETVIHDFENQNDGATPYAGLVAGPSGVLYGAATEGGSANGGTVFELTPSGESWDFSVISNVPGWGGISGSFRNIVVDSKGTIYGTTHCDGAASMGTVYELVPSGGSWDFTLLYTINTSTDGYYLFSNLVVRDGKLYGTANTGGAHNYGAIFEVTP
jgi:uncharacterized repeat protein (TIGR03803 family)